MLRAAKVVWFPSFLAMVAAIAVSPAHAQPRIPDTTLVYARVDTLALKLDLYLPSPAARLDSTASLLRTLASFFKSTPPPDRRPLIVWIHGGGWRGGSRADIPSALPLLQAGYAVASIDYRLSTQALWPAQLHDAKAAVRWLRAHGDTLGIDTTRIVAWGNSAGGHLAALLGLTAPSDSLEGAVGDERGVSASVRAVVDYHGTADFLEYHTRRWKRWSSVGQLLGCAVPDCPVTARRASPSAYASMDDPPFFIVHGTSDTTVPLSQSARLYAALQNAGVSAEFVVMDGAAHGGMSFESVETMARVRAFLDSVLFGTVNVLPKPPVDSLPSPPREQASKVAPAKPPASQ